MLFLVALKKEEDILFKKCKKIKKVKKNGMKKKS